MGQIPRFGLEIVAFGGMFVLILYLVAQNSDLADVLPLIGVYAFVGYRLMPSLQLIYTNFTHLRYSTPAIENLVEEINHLPPAKNIDWKRGDGTLTERIEVKNVSFSYPTMEAAFMENVSLTILAGSKIGLVGQTGSGKSTLVDIILGLLQPNSGGVFVDGVELTSESSRNWQRSVGYVPQHIYLTDSTIASNIAFGVDEVEIDLEAVVRASKVANLHEFISEDLPNGYQTMVGERGVRLSGGQRQRIGIARALYHAPKVLIFDEATSALDNLTEDRVMSAIAKMPNDMTIIMIAHRLTTVEQCDKIVLINDGRIEAVGTAEELKSRSVYFNDLARSGK